MKILLVDDADVFRQSVANLLRSRGHEVIEATNGLDGVKLARAHLPDVVVSDIIMSQVDGYAMTSVLRQHPTTADIPLVLITGEADLKGMRKGMTLGADDYIAKPFKMEELVAALELRVHRRQALRVEVEQKLACLGSGLGMKLPVELSQPLDRILASTALLVNSSQPRSQTELIELAQSIRTDARQVQRLSRNLFAHAQLELFGTNPVHLSILRQAFTPDAGVTVAVPARQCAVAAGREGDLRLNLALCTAAISEVRLAKLVEELVRNAFAYSPAGTPVTVQCYDDGHGFLLTIHDQGRGMPPEQVARLGLVPAPGSGEPQVTGLGLPIARRLAELHGGKLLVTSEPGKGTTVRASLPARPPAPPEPDADPKA